MIKIILTGNVKYVLIIKFLVPTYNRNSISRKSFLREYRSFIEKREKSEFSEILIFSLHVCFIATKVFFITQRLFRFTAHRFFMTRLKDNS